MKKTWTITLGLKKEKGKKNEIIVESDFCPVCMSTNDLCDLISCLSEINTLCINEAYERMKNGEKKHEKRKR